MYRVVTSQRQERSVRLAVFFSLLYAPLAILAAAPTNAIAAVELTTCGQVLTQSGYLTADLDCSGHPDDAVTIENGEKLDLRGFTLTGGDKSAIYCSTGCAVVSTVEAPGMVRGAAQYGIFSDTGRVSVTNLIVEGNGDDGISSGDYSSGSLVATDITTRANGGRGMYAGKSLAAKRVRAFDNAQGGIEGAERVKIQDSEAVGNGAFGINGGANAGYYAACCSGKLTVMRTIVRRNGNGVESGGSVRLSDSQVELNSLAGIIHDGFYPSATLSVKSTDIVDNGGAGIRWGPGNKAKFTAAMVSRNGGDGINAQPWGTKWTILDSAISDNDGGGIRGNDTGTVKLTRCSILRNGSFGVSSADTGYYADECQVKLSGTIVVGNGHGATCGVSETCADLATCLGRAPSLLSGSSCDTSYILGSGFPGNSWAVCAAD